MHKCGSSLVFYCEEPGPALLKTEEWHASGDFVWNEEPYEVDWGVSMDTLMSQESEFTMYSGVEGETNGESEVWSGQDPGSKVLSYPAWRRRSYKTTHQHQVKRDSCGVLVYIFWRGKEDLAHVIFKWYTCLKSRFVTVLCIQPGAFFHVKANYNTEWTDDWKVFL